ncbi:MAG: A24 family peptidase C-terminal domain-containing protein [Sulfolobales archaeon]|nr:hypothetical protein [Sulfolobales archaeon]MDW8083397.1 A24 family peptidase C-terminal domain-containing protein [Sulfolobales archaeon]
MFDSVFENPAILAIVFTFIYTSYRDLVSREIPELSWVPAYLVVLIDFVVRRLNEFSLINTAVAMTPSLIYGLLFALGMIGGADFLAILLVSLGHLSEPLIPLLVFILSSMAPLPIAFINLLRNLTIDRKAIESINCVKGGKKILYLVGRLITVAEFLRKKFAFLHTYPEEEGFICIGSTNVNIDFEEQKKSLERALSRGLVKSDDYVVYSPALPHIVFIAASYLITLLAAFYVRELSIFLGKQL